MNLSQLIKHEHNPMKTNYPLLKLSINKLVSSFKTQKQIQNEEITKLNRTKY